MTGLEVWLDQLPGFIVGAILGTALGWASNARREARRVGVRVDRLEDRDAHRNESGRVAFRWGNIALAVVVALSFYSAVNSQIASNKVVDGQEQRDEDQVVRDRENDCTSTVLFSTVDALDTRTQFSGAQAQANIALQQAQLDLLTAGDDGELTHDEQVAHVNAYVSALRVFLQIATTSAATNQSKPYPSPEDYAACLKRARS